MKKLLIAMAASLTLAAGVVAAQSQTQEQQKVPDVTLTGCLVQGISPSSFVFQGAKKDPQNSSEKPMTFLVLAGTEDLNLREHLNHEVRITGQAENKTPPTPPAGQQVPEKDLPKLTAKAVTMVSNTCSNQ